MLSSNKRWNHRSKKGNDLNQKLKECYVKWNITNDLAKDVNDESIKNYLIGYADAIQWVINELFREERITGKIVINEELLN